MATPMAPPMLSGYSLRVQLFSPFTHGSGDKPVRCFRVVTSPEVTVRDFCKEASRIHEINYGLPLAVKKVQDDQEFDITQTETLGSLFLNTSIIRIIQASPHPNIRDSVPPTSALRYNNPATNRKRDRNGSALSPIRSESPNSNKRQKTAELDPDHPLPSRENELESEGLQITNGNRPDHNFIPNSQESIILGDDSRIFNSSRDVREAVPRISETPSPPASPEMRGSRQFSSIADLLNGKSTTPKATQSSSTRTHVEDPPVRESIENHSYETYSSGAQPKIDYSQRSTQNGASASITATDTAFATQQASSEEGETVSGWRAINTTRKNGSGRFHNQTSVYENITSDEEGPAILATNNNVMNRNGVKPGLPGLEWARNKFSTPNGSRRSSMDHRKSITPGELPLTPKTKAREQKQREEKEKEEGRKVAAEKGKVKADQAREEEETHQAEQDSMEGIEKENTQTVDLVEAVAQKVAQPPDETELAINQIVEEDIPEEHISKRTRGSGSKSIERAKSKSMSPSLPDNQPILPPPRATSTGIKSTPLIPAGRKSALKNAASSQAVTSSPAPPRGSPETFVRGVGIEDQMPLPQKTLRRTVSFTVDEETPKKETPVQPSKKIIKTPHPKARGKKIVEAEFSSDTSATPSVAASHVEVILPTMRNLTPILPPTKSQSLGLQDKISKAGPDILPPTRTRRSIAAVETLVMKAKNTTSSKKQESRNGTPTMETPILPPALKRVLGKVGTPIQSKAKPTRKTNASVTPAKPELRKAKSTYALPSKEKSRSPEMSRNTAPKDVDLTSDSSDDSSSEDIPAVPRPRVLLSPSPESSKSPISKKVVPQPEPDGDRDEDEDMLDADDEKELKNRRSISRESRSPIIYNNKKTSKSPRSKQPSSHGSKSSSEAEEEPPVVSRKLSKREDEAEETESDGESTPKPKVNTMAKNSAASTRAKSEVIVKSGNAGKDKLRASLKTGVNKDETSSSDSDSDSSSISTSDSDSSSDQEVQAAQIPLPASSPPVAPKTRTLKPELKSQSGKEYHSFSDSGMNTEDEIDQQLTCSIREAESSVAPIKYTPMIFPPSTIPETQSQSQSQLPRPRLKVGASLSRLNSTKPKFDPHAAKKTQKPSGTQFVLTQAGEGSESESEDSDSDSTSNSDSEKASLAKPSKETFSTPPSTQKPNVAKPSKGKGSGSSSSSSSSSDSDSDDSNDSGSEDEAARLRSELAAQIEGVGKQSPVKKLASPKPFQSSPGPAVARKASTGAGANRGNGKNVGGARDKYTSRYSLSQPR